MSMKDELERKRLAAMMVAQSQPYAPPQTHASPHVLVENSANGQRMTLPLGVTYAFAPEALAAIRDIVARAVVGDEIIAEAQAIDATLRRIRDLLEGAERNGDPTIPTHLLRKAFAIDAPESTEPTEPTNINGAR